MAARNAVKRRVRSSIGLRAFSMHPYTPGIQILQGEAACSFLPVPGGLGERPAASLDSVSER